MEHTPGHYQKHYNHAPCTQRYASCEHVPYLVPEERAEAHPDDKSDEDARHVVVVRTRILLPVALEQLLDLEAPAVRDACCTFHQM